MTPPRTLIVVLIDGLSADYFATQRARLPHLSRLADDGTLVRRLRAATPALSMPARATMLTGVGADSHGIYGNHLFDGDRFRLADAEDVAVPTIAAVARAAGRVVASIGFALVHPNDADIFVPPWWRRNEAPDDHFSKIPGPPTKFSCVKDPMGRLDGILEDAFAPGAVTHHPIVSGLAGDQRNLRAVLALATAPDAPDLILTEFLMPDSLQHQFGYESEAAHMATQTVDMMIGALIHAVQTAKGRDYALALASDHGHGPIETAIHADAVIRHTPVMGEGGTLTVVLRGPEDHARIAERLRPFGVAPGGSGHVPPALRGRVATFFAPPRHSFEDSPVPGGGTAVTGPPTHVSSHGFCPGSPVDDRVCILAGTGFRRAAIDVADADRFTPTLAQWLGLALPGTVGTPL